MISWLKGILCSSAMVAICVSDEVYGGLWCLNAHTPAHPHTHAQTHTHTHTLHAGHSVTYLITMITFNSSSTQNQSIIHGYLSLLIH